MRLCPKNMIDQTYFLIKKFKKLVQMFDQLFLWRENNFVATGLFLALVKQRAASEPL